MFNLEGGGGGRAIDQLIYQMAPWKSGPSLTLGEWGNFGQCLIFI